MSWASGADHICGLRCVPKGAADEYAASVARTLEAAQPKPMNQRILVLDKMGPEEGEKVQCSTWGVSAAGTVTACAPAEWATLGSSARPVPHTRTSTLGLQSIDLMQRSTTAP